MSQVYLEYCFFVKPLSLGNEILMAELGYVGFESFLENPMGLKAYIQKKDWNENILNGVHEYKEVPFIGYANVMVKYFGLASLR